ncbi:MAG: type II toxin-antitoxin system RelE/ParE family toxin [Anaerolineales bacterium]
MGEPFTEWLDYLKDKAGRAKIRAPLARLRAGNFGDCRSVGSGVWELRIDFGPGYRVYYEHIERNKVILLLGGGSKSSQKEDVQVAKRRWQHFQDN